MTDTIAKILKQSNYFGQEMVKKYQGSPMLGCVELTDVPKILFIAVILHSELQNN